MNTIFPDSPQKMGIIIFVSAIIIFSGITSQNKFVKMFVIGGGVALLLDGIGMIEL